MKYSLWYGKGKAAKNSSVPLQWWNKSAETPDKLWSPPMKMKRSSMGHLSLEAMVRAKDLKSRDQHDAGSATPMPTPTHSSQ
jgi:hypothetical protein